MLIPRLQKMNPRPYWFAFEQVWSEGDTTPTLTTPIIIICLAINVISNMRVVAVQEEHCEFLKWGLFTADPQRESGGERERERGYVYIYIAREVDGIHFYHRNRKWKEVLETYGKLEINGRKKENTGRTIKLRRKHFFWAAVKMFLQMTCRRYASQIWLQTYYTSLISSHNSSRLFTCKLGIYITSWIRRNLWALYIVCHSYFWHRSFAWYGNLRVAHTPEMPETFFPPPRVSDPDMHHNSCVTHTPWCMRVSLTSGFFWSRWWRSDPGIPGTRVTRNFAYLVRSPW